MPLAPLTKRQMPLVLMRVPQCSHLRLLQAVPEKSQLLLILSLLLTLATHPMAKSLWWDPELRVTWMWRLDFLRPVSASLQKPKKLVAEFATALLTAAAAAATLLSDA